MADSQLRKGVLELIVLASLAASPTYGGALLSRLSAIGLDVSTGTLYPLLTRLKKAGHIASHWEESPAGPPRKIYDITTQGRQHARELTNEWRTLAHIIETTVKGL